MNRCDAAGMALAVVFVLALALFPAAALAHEEVVIITTTTYTEPVRSAPAPDRQTIIFALIGIALVSAVAAAGMEEKEKRMTDRKVQPPTQTGPRFDQRISEVEDRLNRAETVLRESREAASLLRDAHQLTRDERNAARAEAEEERRRREQMQQDIDDMQAELGELQAHSELRDKKVGEARRALEAGLRALDEVPPRPGSGQQERRQAN